MGCYQCFNSIVILSKVWKIPERNESVDHPTQVLWHPATTVKIVLELEFLSRETRAGKLYEVICFVESLDSTFCECNCHIWVEVEVKWDIYHLSSSSHENTQNS